MQSNWKRLPGLPLVSLLVLVANAHADKRTYSTEELESTATHIVVGKVQAIYSRTEREGDYEYVRKVAEVKVDKLEKGRGPADLVYVRYFDRNWKGKGPVPPGGGSHAPQPKTGGTYRFYLARNAYDGWSGQGTRDGGYNVVYVNGVQPAKADKPKERSKKLREPKDESELKRIDRGERAPAIKLGEALEIARSHLESENVDVSAHYLDSIRLMKNEITGQRHWMAIWPPNKAGLGGEILMSIPMDRKLKPAIERGR